MNKDIFVSDINGNIIVGNKDEVLDSFCINTKEIKPGDIFVGMKGENVDGSKFYLDAFNRGAKGCILNKGVVTDYEEVPGFIVEVDDTLICLQDLAKLKRSKYDIPVIAVTGSVGKTSTKDIISSVVSTKYKVLKTEGNHNNEIGLPLTILSLKDHNAMVVEMGMSALGEISLLSTIAKPTIGVITNVGTAHIGVLGSRENILKAKLEICDGLSGELIINNDNDMLHKAYINNSINNEVVTIGIDNDSDYMAKDINYDYDYEGTIFNCNNEEYKIKSRSDAFVYNSLEAIAVGNILGINIDDIRKGLENFKLTSGRTEVIKANGYIVINDCYNASYDSIKEAISFLNKSKSLRKIIVLGDVLELGDFSKELHEKIGKEVLNSNIDILVTVGKEANYIYEVNKDKKESYHFDTNEDAIKYLKSIIKDNDEILIKASHGMNFIEIVDALK